MDGSWDGATTSLWKELVEQTDWIRRQIVANIPTSGFSFTRDWFNTKWGWMLDYVEKFIKEREKR